MADTVRYRFCHKCGAILPIVDYKAGDILRCRVCNHGASKCDLNLLTTLVPWKLRTS